MLENAVTYTGDDGHVLLSGSAVPDGVVIRVCDNGPGMTKEEQLHLFDRYYTVPRHRKNQSTGLGLVIARDLIQLHGGTLHVTSAPEKGTEFTILLPSHTEKEDSFDPRPVD